MSKFLSWLHPQALPIVIGGVLLLWGVGVLVALMMLAIWVLNLAPALRTALVPWLIPQDPERSFLIYALGSCACYLLAAVLAKPLMRQDRALEKLYLEPFKEEAPSLVQAVLTHGELAAVDRFLSHTLIHTLAVCVILSAVYFQELFHFPTWTGAIGFVSFIVFCGWQARDMMGVRSKAQKEMEWRFRSLPQSVRQQAQLLGPNNLTPGVMAAVVEDYEQRMRDAEETARSLHTDTPFASSLSASRRL